MWLHVNAERKEVVFHKTASACWHIVTLLLVKMFLGGRNTIDPDWIILPSIFCIFLSRKN